MELRLTGGVLFSLLCEIKKEPISKSQTRSGKKDPASELEMMKALCEIAQGHKYNLNEESLRTKLTHYKNFECNGNELIPLEAKLNDKGILEKPDVYLFNRNAIKNKIWTFIDRFINVEDSSALQFFKNKIVAIILFDDDIKRYGSKNPFVIALKDVDNNKTYSFDTFLYEVIYCVIAYHTDNVSGSYALSLVSQRDFVHNYGHIQIEIDESTAKMINTAGALEDVFEARDGWEEYISNLKKEYTNVKIYYDPDREYPFDKIYVPSSLATIDPFGINTVEEVANAKTFDNPTAESITHYSKSIFISGAGGLGKTMLMRHLLLKAIELELFFVPIFISVRYFSDKYDDFVDFVYAQCKQYSQYLTKDVLLKALSARKCILFLDGFDEIPFEYLSDFISKYNQFVRVDTGNRVIMSSRPVSSSAPNHISTMYIMPLSEEGSCELVEKLARLQNDPDLGKNFINELNGHLFRSHKEYVQNPLLLTLMLRIYQQNRMIPELRFDFYYEAYQVLSHKHDALNKEGGFLRKYKTGLNPTGFAKCFKEFCAYSLMEGRTTFMPSDMYRYFYMIKFLKNNDLHIDLDDFIYDCTVSTGLMYLQGDHYSFIHRSMQEFFCAWFITSQEDKYLLDIALKLQSYGVGLSFGTFELLEERIPHKMKKYVYLPYLKSIIIDYDEREYDSYANFLFRFYNNIRYVSKSVAHIKSTYIEPSEALYYFCMRHFRSSISDKYIGLPECEEFEGEAIYEYYDGNAKLVAGTDFDIPSDYDYEKYGEPQLVGHYYDLSMRKVLADGNRFPEIKDRIYDDRFQLKQEFEFMRRYWSELEKECESIDDGSDLFAQLR